MPVIGTFIYNKLMTPIKIDFIFRKKFFSRSQLITSKIEDTYYQAVKNFGDLERGINSRVTKRIHESNKRWMARNAENERSLTAYQKTFGKEDEWDFDTMIRFNKNKTEEMTAVNFRLSDRAI